MIYKMFMLNLSVCIHIVVYYYMFYPISKEVYNVGVCV